MKKKQYWYSLDNAAKVFPAVSNVERSSVFRLSFYLNETIDPAILEQAVNEVLPRFESFAVTLKSGLFWYYIAANRHHFQVKKESPILCKYVPWANNNGYLFSVYYFENKITLETFHSLSDGTGAMEFLKSITYTYFKLRGLTLEHEGVILSQTPYTVEETSDMFVNSYDLTNKKKLNEAPAYHITGEKFSKNFTLAIRIKVLTEELLELTRNNDVTIGEYVTALMAYSIYTQIPNKNQFKKPIKMFIPVNLRKYFKSKTLRNFSLYLKVTFSPKVAWDFHSMLIETKNQFKEQLNKEDLHARMNANVGIEKNPLIRILPLPLKNIAFQLGYYYFAENINTFSISNLGNVKLPNTMNELIKDIDFSIGGTNMAIASVHGATNLMFNTQYKDVSIVQTFIKHLTEQGLAIQIDTNYREGLDEIL